MHGFLRKVGIFTLRLVVSTLVMCFLFFGTERVSFAKDRREKQRLRKLEEVKEKKEKETEERPTLLKSLVDKATLVGFVELNYEYVDVSDTGDENSDSSSDLYIGTVDLGLGLVFNEWVESQIVVSAEDIGKQGEDGKIRLDEAIIRLESPWAPLYLVGGKTVLPFGVFEDYMISGTLTEDLYEIQKWGATLGFAPDFHGLDISFTLYQGQDVIENLSDFDTHEFRAERKKENNLGSFIANVTLEPIEDMLIFSAFYDSEPGDGRRNQSIGGAMTLNGWKLSLDTEYITALERENGENGEENRESAWIMGLAFRPFEPLELAVRYEGFHDDNPGDQDEVLDYRYLAGFNYSFLDFATLSFEYRHSRFEKEIGSEATDELNEVNLQLTLEF